MFPLSSRGKNTKRHLSGFPGRLARSCPLHSKQTVLHVESEKYNFIGVQALFSSPKSRELLSRVHKLALTDASVLIEGESGSGKEVVARALHQQSMRCARPWVDISCAALPEHLVESELFGYEKGAFSGADSRKEGLFELADKGTLFLDEVGELPPRLQAKLLRVLDCGNYYKLGGTRKVQVNVRVVAATNRDLRQAVEAGEFRKDLYHRLAQLRVTTLPLRELPEDVLPLAEMFLAQASPGCSLSVEAAEALVSYGWPGNIRELRNVIIMASALCSDGVVRRHDLPCEVAGPLSEPLHDAGLLKLGSGTGTHAESGEEPAPGGLLERVERTVILDVLRRMEGHQEKAARVLGISSRTLARRLRVYAEDTPTVEWAQP
jgi:DNA-binding NtrC family response regulator